MPLKCGDVREDGFKFWGYRRKPDGTKREIWVRPETFERNRAVVRKHNKLKSERLKSDKQLRTATTQAIKKWLHEDYRRRMYYMAKASNRTRGVPFDLSSYEDIPYTEICPVFGWKLEIGGGLNSPSLDRIIPELGYVKGNIVVVSLLANQIKSNATPDQIMAVAKFYKKLRK